jgi:hypothetical protein
VNWQEKRDSWKSGSRPPGTFIPEAVMPILKEYGEQAGEMEVFPEFGIDGYSHLFIIAYFDRLGRNRSDLCK